MFFRLVFSGRVSDLGMQEFKESGKKQSARMLWADTRGGEKEAFYQPATGKYKSSEERTTELSYRLEPCVHETSQAIGHTWLLPTTSFTARFPK